MIEDSLNYVVYPLYLQTVLECQELKKIPDMHDRIIVATAKILRAKVLTKDEEIIEFGEVEVVR
jgi:PIN domain nuclease of toxin-antitoxin system